MTQYEIDRIETVQAQDCEAFTNFMKPESGKETK
jgi:hypothetical protein